MDDLDTLPMASGNAGTLSQWLFHLVGTAVVVVLWLGFCNKIVLLKDSPDRYLRRQVDLVGTVTDAEPSRVGLYSVYRLKDFTGSVWIATRHGAPAVGSRVYVKGQFHREVPSTFATVSKLRPEGPVVEESFRLSSCARSSPAPPKGGSG